MNKADWESLHHLGNLKGLDLGQAVSSDSIPYGNFQGRKLQTVTLPKGLTCIGQKAFMNCKSLSTVCLQDGLRIIDTDAFSGCEQLMLLQGTLSALEKLGSNAFKDCRSLSSVPSAGHIKTVPEACFSGCSNLESFTLPEDLEMIEPFAFYQCARLGTLLPPSLQQIRHHAFYGTDMRTVKVPENCSVDDSVFAKCAHLSSLDLPMSYFYASLTKGVAADCPELAASS